MSYRNNLKSQTTTNCRIQPFFTPPGLGTCTKNRCIFFCFMMLISCFIYRFHLPDVRGVFKKYREFWIFAGYVYSNFDFLLCCYICLTLMLISSVILNVQLIVDSCFACTFFGSSSIFTYLKKNDKEPVSNFVWKTKLSARMHSEFWLWHTEKLLWIKVTIIGGTKCFQKIEKMWTTKSLPDARTLQQHKKKLMKWRKWYWPIVELPLEKLPRT